MASIYTVMITCKKKTDDDYKSKLFEFLNKKTAAKVMRKLVREMEAITGEKALQVCYGNNITYFSEGDDYYHVTCRKRPVTTLNDSNLNFQFKDEENED